ncbi:GntR family transcriptional regulator [Roseovarius sp. C7]|uniref:GntR family transcriptional regulator n=1 Tax=Roseovarius sp. C7 TaxID=3398643 RepID=UPI0039F66263
MRRRILTQQIAPGSDLDEATLCEEYGLSRTPMREIFQRLAGEGFVQIEQNRGAKVSSMDLATMRVFFQTAPLIYCNVARQAAENHHPVQLEHLRKVQEAFRAANAAGDAEAASFLNHQFHQQMGLMAQNPYLLVALNRMLIDHTRLSQTFYRPSSEDGTRRVESSVAQHDAMLEAMAQRDGESMVSLTMDHWNLTRDQLERYVMPDPLPLGSELVEMGA